MDEKILEKKSFEVIGMAREGFTFDSKIWIPQLWQEVRSRFNEIRDLAKLDSEGNRVGMWGVMGDLDGKFKRWAEQGIYLAGCEVKDGAAAPAGFTKWVIPSYKYVVTKCTKNTYTDVFNTMVDKYIPEHNYTIVGRVNESYGSEDSSGEYDLYFPIEEL